MASEVGVVRGTFDGDVVVLQPYEQGDGGLARTLDRRPARDHHRLPARRPARPGGRRRTTAGAGRGAHLDAPPRPVRGRTWPPPGPLLADVTFEGWTIHLPLREEGRYAEAVRLARAALAVAPGTLWLSHLPSERGRVRLAAELGGPDGPVPVRARVGTRLWLGDAGRTADDRDRPRRAPGPPGRARRLPRSRRARGRLGRGRRRRHVPRRRARGPHLGVVPGGSGRPRWPPARWRRPVARSARSRSTAGSAGSSSRRTCSRAWCSCPPRPPRRAVGDEVPVELRLTIATPDAVILCAS